MLEFLKFKLLVEDYLMDTVYSNILLIISDLTEYRSLERKLNLNNSALSSNNYNANYTLSSPSLSLPSSYQGLVHHHHLHHHHLFMDQLETRITVIIIIGVIAGGQTKQVFIVIIQVSIAVSINTSITSLRTP
jgi:hypothetical protein